MKLADKISLSRILMAPLFFIAYYFPLRTGIGVKASVLILVPLLAVMEMTDFFDGYYARKLHQVSDFGKLFDPFADVMAHLTVFFCLVLSGYMPAELFLIIFFREYAMLFLRMMALREGTAIGASWGGKTKTVVYIAGIIYALLLEAYRRWTGNDVPVAYLTGGYILFAAGTLLSLGTFCGYAVKYRRSGGGMRGTEE